MFRTYPVTQLTCDGCRLRLNDYVDGTLPVALAQTVEAHLDVCVACAALARDFKKIRVGLRALPRPQTSAGFEAALLARLQNVPTRTFRTTAQAALRPLLAVGALCCCRSRADIVSSDHFCDIYPACAGRPYRFGSGRTLRRTAQSRCR